MTSEIRKNKLSNLISKYYRFKSEGKLDLSSEETIRSWLNDFLEIFNWDVKDTSQVLQEKVLSTIEKEKLKDIGSTNTRPDYTLKLAKQKITFLDAKDISISLHNDAKAAFQIKSYGWSIQAPCAFISNFEEFVIYDTSYMPSASQPATFGRIYLTIDNFIDNFEIIEEHLLKENVYNGKLNLIYSDSMRSEKGIIKESLDIQFAEKLSNFRLLLAQNILINNLEFIDGNTEKLSYIVQIIINRLLFIRVCEARKIEEEGLLLSFKAEGFWTKFRESSYLNFYNHYDGPLFDRIAAIHHLSITDEVFDYLLDYLYYPSPYRFDVIPTKLLSDIYELFLSKKMLISNNIVSDQLKSEYTKTKGAVSTPQYIVQEIIKRTIDKTKAISSISELLQMKILDIACGSGVFAIELYDYLEECLIQSYLLSKQDAFTDYFIEIGGNVIVNLKGKRSILESCIFGIDIDPEAVEVTKMSLSLKIIDSSDYPEAYSEIGLFGFQILNGIGNNIRCGNSLVESDILNFSPELLNRENELLRTNIFDWNSTEGFQPIFSLKGGFDYIIGNPPYVEVKNYNVDLPIMHQYIKNTYESSKNGKVDLAIPFIEKAMSLLNSNGKLGLIIQKRFFKTDYGKAIRNLITRSNYLYSIIDFETTSIFKDRLTYVAVMILSKQGNERFYYKLFQSSVQTLESDLRMTNTPDIEPDAYNILPSTSITQNPWSFDSPELLNIKTKLNRLGNLSDYANVKVGVQVLWGEAYHIRPISINGNVLIGRTHLEQSFTIEVEACRPLICNEKFICYRKDTPDVYVIFPYEIQDGKSIPLTFSEFSEKYPLAGEYLSRNKNLITNTVETLPADYWHLYTRANNHSYVNPKVLVPMTALDTFASLTFSSNTYCDNANMFFIDIENKTEENLLALSAVINSTVFSVLARSIANPQDSGYYKFNKQFLDPVAFPVFKFETNQDNQVIELAAISKNIMINQTKYQSAPPTQKRTFKTLLERDWNALDHLVYKLYDLTDREIEFFEQKGRNIDRIKILDI